MLGYTGLEVGSDDIMLAAAGPKGRKSTAVS
jgi:RNA polymerase sigma-70 factor (ECF subfamily)